MRVPAGLFLALALSGFPAQAGVSLVENKIKAGLIYNFLKYTEWPAESMAATPAQMVVCIYGMDSFDGNLQPMTERTVNQRDIKIRTVRNAGEAADCHLLFVNSAEAAQWPQLRDSLKGKSILTVSDLEHFTSSGGMIEFVRKDDRINVELNMSAVEEAKLHVQDRLLKLTHVAQAASGGGR